MFHTSFAELIDPVQPMMNAIRHQFSAGSSNARWRATRSQMEDQARRRVDAEPFVTAVRDPEAFTRFNEDCNTKGSNSTRTRSFGSGCQKSLQSEPMHILMTGAPGIVGRKLLCQVPESRALSFRAVHTNGRKSSVTPPRLHTSFERRAES